MCHINGTGYAQYHKDAVKKRKKTKTSLQILSDFLENLQLS